MKLLILTAGITAMLSTNIMGASLDLIDATIVTGVQVKGFDLNRYEYPPLLIKDNAGKTYLGEAKGDVASGRVNVRLTQSCSSGKCVRVTGWAVDANDMIFGLKADMQTRSPAINNLIDTQTLQIEDASVGEKPIAKTLLNGVAMGMHKATWPTMIVKAGQATKLLIDNSSDEPKLSSDDRFQKVMEGYKQEKAARNNPAVKVEAGIPTKLNKSDLIENN